MSSVGVAALGHTAPALRQAWPGLVAFTGGVAWVAADTVAIVLAVTGQFLAATVIAQVLIVLSAASFLLGIAALALRRGRWWGLGGALLSATANPMVLLVGAGFIVDL